MDHVNQFEKILESDYRLVSIETYDVDRIVDLFHQLDRYSSKALYMWSPNEGMHRLGAAAHITIPRTQTARHVLEHIEGCAHYGVYVLRDVGEWLHDRENIALLTRIATAPNPKVVVFLNEYIDLPQALRPFTLRSRHQLRKAS